MINSNNQFVNFLIEIIMRIGQKSPKVFIYLQWISSAVAAIAGIPAFLDGIGVKVTGVAATFESHTVAIAALVGLFVSLLPVQGKAVAVNPNGEPLKVTDQAKLPFTAKAENKAEAEVNHPVVATPKK